LNNLFRYNSVLEEDIQILEEKLKQFEDLESFRTKITGVDVKLIEKEKLEEIENELRASKAELGNIAQEFEKYKALYENELHLNQVLSKKIEDVTNRNKRLELMISDYEKLEEEKKMLEHSARLQNELFNKEKETLETQLHEFQETAKKELKKELERRKDKFIDQVLEINNQIKKYCMNLTSESQLQGITEEEMENDEKLIKILKQNIEELSRVYEKELEREKNKFREEKKNIEKSANEDYQNFKKSLQKKFEEEKKDLEKDLERKFQREKEDYLSQIEDLKKQISTMIPKNTHEDLLEELRAKERHIKTLEEEMDKWPKLLEAELEKKAQEVRKENLTSLSALKEKHEKDLADNAGELRQYYEQLMQEDKKKIEKLEEENVFLSEELESANKQIFDLMRYKVDFEDALVSERKKLEGEYLDKHKVLSIEFENKIQELQNAQKRTVQDYERKLKELEAKYEKEKSQYNNTLEEVKESYYHKLEELEQIHQASMQQVIYFRELLKF